MKHPLLEIQGLTVDFKDDNTVVHALHQISFKVDRGETVAIVGESGSGKSVTSLSLLQLLPKPPAQYVSGNIYLSTNGEERQDLLRLSDEALRKLRGNEIAMIFQEPMTSLNPVFTCGQQVMEAIQLHQQAPEKEARATTIELFRQVNLPEPEKLFHRYPHQLSGGQKQRVMIAMAMSCNPSLLIADEPTTALDVTVQKNILMLLKDLQAQHHIGIIFISHDLALVAEIADRVVVMYKGKIVEEGRTEDILHRARHPYTKALLACRPVLHPKGERLPVVSDFMEVTHEGDIIEKHDAGRQPKPTAVTVSGTMQRNILLEVKNLNVVFSSARMFSSAPAQVVKAVNNVSFEVYEGETLGLVGESGSGKTTLGRALLRLVQPTSGRVLFGEKDLLLVNQAELRNLRKKMQIIFQDPYSSLNPGITVGHAIMEPMRIHGIGKNDRERKEKAIALLEKVNLKPEHFKRYPHEFSGGQRQRIVIARALALNPSFVICDESVSSLDVSIQAQVLNLLSDLRKEFGFTAIFISHDLSVVRYISDRIMVLNKGSIEEIGNAEQVYHHPSRTYTRTLIDSIPGKNQFQK